MVVREDEGVAMVCVSVQEPTVDCPIAFTFVVNVITSDGNASKYSPLLCGCYVYSCGLYKLHFTEQEAGCICRS